MQNIEEYSIYSFNEESPTEYFCRVKDKTNLGNLNKRQKHVKALINNNHTRTIISVY